MRPQLGFATDLIIPPSSASFYAVMDHGDLLRECRYILSQITILVTGLQRLEGHQRHPQPPLPPVVPLGHPAVPPVPVVPEVPPPLPPPTATTPTPPKASSVRPESCESESDVEDGVITGSRSLLVALGTTALGGGSRSTRASGRRPGSPPETSRGVSREGHGPSPGARWLLRISLAYLSAAVGSRTSRVPSAPAGAYFSRR